MTWLLCAHRPLSTQEFITAVSVDTSATDTGGLYIALSPSQLLNICCNMIVLDEEMDMFRFAHLSVQEYLEGRGDFGKIVTNSTALEICILVNSLELETYPRSTTSLSNMQFKSYALLTWPIHCEAAGDGLQLRIKDRVTGFLSSKFAAWKSAVRMLRLTPGGKLIYPEMNLNLISPTPLYLVFRFGLLWILHYSDIFESWWNIEIASFDGPPVHVAARYGQKELLRLLLAKKNNMTKNEYLKNHFL